MASLVKKMVLLASMLVFFGNSAFAVQEYKLFETTNDAGIPNSDMYLLTDDTGAPQQLKIVYKAEKSLTETLVSLEEKLLFLEVDSVIEKNDTQIFDVEALYDGITIVNMKGFDVVIIKAEVLDPITGGTIILDYLENGLTRARTELRFDVKRNAESKWDVLYENKKVNKVSFYKRILFGQPVGIKSVIVE